MGYDFTKVGVTGLKVLGQYIKINQDASTGVILNNASSDTKTKYWEGQISYDIPSLKGLTLSLEYENATKDVAALGATAASSTDSNEMRFRANYKF